MAFGSATLMRRGVIAFGQAARIHRDGVALGFARRAAAWRVHGEPVRVVGDGVVQDALAAVPDGEGLGRGIGASDLSREGQGGRGDRDLGRRLLAEVERDGDFLGVVISVGARDRDRRGISGVLAGHAAGVDGEGVAVDLAGGTSVGGGDAQPGRVIRDGVFERVLAGVSYSDFLGSRGGPGFRGDERDVVGVEPDDRPLEKGGIGGDGRLLAVGEGNEAEQKRSQSDRRLQRRRARKKSRMAFIPASILA